MARVKHHIQSNTLHVLSGEEVTQEGDLIVTTSSGSVLYSLQDDANFELSDEFADGSQKIIYTGSLSESQVVVLVVTVSFGTQHGKAVIMTLDSLPLTFKATEDGATYPIRSTTTAISVEMVFGNTTTLPGVPTFEQPSYLRNLTLDHEEIEGRGYYQD